MSISCIVLAGGKGLRLGRDKLQEVIGGRSLLQWVISGLSCFNTDIIVVTSRGRDLPLPSGYPALHIAYDIYPNRGALGGIYTGLKVSASEYNIVVAGDIPFLNQALLQHMAGLAPGFDLVIPRLGGMLEPLHAVYTKSCLAPIERQLGRGELRISALLDSVKVRYLESDEIDRFDPKHLSFFNINTEADLERARQIAKEVTGAKC